MLEENKNNIKGMCKLLTYIIILSFNTGVFPDKMKGAKVIPLFKSGDRYNLTNYRPISLLSQIFVKGLDFFYLFIGKHSLLSEVTVQQH